VTGQQSDPTAADVLIIGFGFSVIPLLREMDREGRSYLRKEFCVASGLILLQFFGERR
jgi:hypothetical protein